MAIETITAVDNIETNLNQWNLIYNPLTKNIIVEPIQSSGFTSSPYAMIIADTEEEINQYITDNNLNIIEEVYDYDTI